MTPAHDGSVLNVILWDLALASKYTRNIKREIYRYYGLYKIHDIVDF